MPDNGGGEKQVDPAALARSVIETPKAAGESIPSLDTSLLWFVAQAASAISQWGRNIKLRDRQLRDFYPTENYFTAGLGTVSARNAAFSWELVGSGAMVRHFQDVFMHSGSSFVHQTAPRLRSLESTIWIQVSVGIPAIRSSRLFTETKMANFTC